MIHLATPRTLVKAAFLLAATLLAAGSLVVSGRLTAQLKQEEQSKMQTWAQAMQTLAAAESDADLSLVLRILNQNHTIPIIVLDPQSNVVDHRNLGSEPTDAAELEALAADMMRSGRQLHVSMPESAGVTVCYGESQLLRRLTLYPYVQLAVVALLVAVAIYALRVTGRADQDRLWVGLSRETAHQLGTPISSLMAWNELLREAHPADPLVFDVEADVARLQLVAERFSKIGAKPCLEPHDVHDIVMQALAYVGRRIPHSVRLDVTPPESPLQALADPSLLAWVVENLVKNAVDAMPTGGVVSLRYAQGQHGRVVIEVSDSGCGIPRSAYRAVFRPGYTTKKRGWGLGLSLARRIVEQYHRGRIYVKSSSPSGTTFAIELRRSLGQIPQA